LPTLDEKTAGTKKHEGFLDFYWDDASGKIWMDISRLDTALLYATSLPAGLGSNDIGLDRGLQGGERIVRFQRVGRKIFMVQPNYGFRATSGDKAEQRAAEQSFAQSTLWGFTVEAENKGHALVDATDFLLRDAMGAANQVRRAQQGNFAFDRSRSAVYLPGSKNFPLNTELETSITFVNTDGTVGEYVRSVSPSDDVFTVRMHHSFVQLPDNNFKPRAFDPRSSFFAVSYYDFSTPVSEPIVKYLAVRHRLQKKDPSAARSEAVKPIVYYLDNGTPEPIRSALLEGASWWNEAFEAAGYINAFQVKLLPEDADPMDLRYNMINWVHRSTRGWSYGASVVDPRTGEIIKGNVTLGSLRVRQDYLIAQGLLAPFEKGAPKDDAMLKVALNRLKQLAAHEVGHTLGLMHNYAASVSNRASVMDYPHPTVKLAASGAIDLTDAYARGIGEWDKVAITWGYSDFPGGAAEKPALDTLLAGAARRGLQFLSDRDANSRVGLHPSAHLWDNGANAVAELKNVMLVRARALQQFGTANIREGMPMAMLEDVLVPIYLFHRYQVEAATKLVGGMNYTYALKGDGQLVTKPLSRAEQQKALSAILDCLDPEVLVLPDRITALIPPRPAGYLSSRELFRKRTGIAFDVLSPAETAADLPLSLLFAPERLNRLAAAGAQKGGYGLEEMIGTVLERTWKAPRRAGMEGLVQQQTEQVVLTYLLAASVNDNSSFVTRATVAGALQELKTFIEAKKKATTDGTYAGHLLLALDRMKAPEKARPTLHAEIPPGAPIGCTEE
ncbi:MAG TPA: zinc-dependent metalloprotease, partial [Candidatus Sulfotelmatobacter sp.]|nr:zinc-dependent metalloprotease [Candidatus Sulfotelmatobacter sp.]